MCNLNTCLFIVLKIVLRHCTTMECNYFKKPQTSFRGLCSWKQEFLFIFIPSKYLHRGEAMEGNLNSENRTFNWGRCASAPSGEPCPPRKRINLWESPLKRNFLQKKKVRSSFLLLDSVSFSRRLKWEVRGEAEADGNTMTDRECWRRQNVASVAYRDRSNKCFCRKMSGY